MHSILGFNIVGENRIQDPCGYNRCREQSVSGTHGVLTELKAMIPKALSLDRMVTVALFGVPTVTPLDELWEGEKEAKEVLW